MLSPTCHFVNLVVTEFLVKVGNSVGIIYERLRGVYEDVCMGARTLFRVAEQLRGPFEKFVNSLYYSIYVFEKWVERCKKCITCQGRYFEKETVTAPPQSSDSE
jgi:hypothetical protein